MSIGLTLDVNIVCITVCRFVQSEGILMNVSVICMLLF